MNKAFVKEAETGEPRCPEPAGCGSIGIPVTRRTLLAQLPEDAARRFSETAFYCSHPGCRVAYFDNWGTIAPRTELRVQAYPKSSTAPVCSCFGVAIAEIREAAEAGRKGQVRELLARTESTEARCEAEAPSGTSCAAEIRRIFLEHFTPQ